LAFRNPAGSLSVGTSLSLRPPPLRCRVRRPSSASQGGHEHLTSAKRCRCCLRPVSR
jgi:hypothetical protein